MLEIDESHIYMEWNRLNESKIVGPIINLELISRSWINKITGNTSQNSLNPLNLKPVKLEFKEFESEIISKFELKKSAVVCSNYSDEIK